jgi:hypothetical protein
MDACILHKATMFITHHVFLYHGVKKDWEASILGWKRGTQKVILASAKMELRLWRLQFS